MPQIMTFASLFGPFEEETEDFVHVSDDEDPALYELLKDTPMAKCFKNQKTSQDAESSDRISDVGLDGDDLDSASLDNGWDDVSIGDDWANGDDQAE
ncbi:unnamed protein product [Rhizopus stolonifer]